jgi:hypothetical protein
VGTRRAPASGTVSKQAGSTAGVAAPLSITYERHRPETTTLYAVVRDNINTLYGAVEAGFSGVALPAFVRDELEGYCRVAFYVEALLC